MPETSGRVAAVRRLAREHWPVFPLLALLAAALVLRLHYLDLHTEYTADSYYFLILARSIARGFEYTVRGAPHTKYLPGYPVAIWLGSYVAGGIGNSANAIAVAGGTLSVLVTYLLGKELWNRWVGLAAAFILAFQPTFLKWTSLPMTEGMFTLLFSLGVYLLLTGCRRASPARRALGALSGGLCLLTRGEGVLFGPLAVLIILLYLKEARIRWWEPGLMLLLFGGPVGVYVIRNQLAAGRLTAYGSEYERNRELSFALLKHRFKVYAWQGMSGSFYYVLFYLGAAWCLARRKWKQFLIAGSWFALFVVFHMFWYYTYERFMAPAAPAVALMIGFLFYELVAGVRKLFGPGGAFRRKLAGWGGASAAGVAFQFVGYALVAALAAALMAHGLIRADGVIAENYRAFADDHGGAGMAEAAEWLRKNAPGQTVAVDAGPYFDWLYEGSTLYVRPVPWDLPVEDRDVDAPFLASKLYDRGVRYLVIGQTEEGVEAELDTIGMRPEDLSRLREVARWTNHYDYPGPHELATVIFEVLPPP